jgi:hypothetical protein
MYSLSAWIIYIYIAYQFVLKHLYLILVVTIQDVCCIDWPQNLLSNVSLDFFHSSSYRDNPVLHSAVAIFYVLLMQRLKLL